MLSLLALQGVPAWDSGQHVLIKLITDTFPPSFILSLLIPGLILELPAPWVLSLPGLRWSHASLLLSCPGNSSLCVCIRVGAEGLSYLSSTPLSPTLPNF